jgi:hypothetical protein
MTAFMRGVDVDIWERVQQRLASQTQTRRVSQPDDNSFLVGKLYDDRGHRMGASHASKGGRHWRYYVSRAALSGCWKDAGSVVRIPAPEIENSIANAVEAHLAARANAIDDCHTGRGGGRGDCAITQRESARTQRSLPSQNDVRNAIDRATVSATRIEIVLNESIIVEGQDQILTLPWTRSSSRRRREISRALAKRRDPDEPCEQKRETVSSGRCATLAAGSTNFLSTLLRLSSRSPCANIRVSARFG